MSKLVGGLFGGGKPQVATGATPYQQTPDFVKSAFEQLFGGAGDLSGGLNQAQQNLYQMGLEGPAGMGFMKGAQGAFGQGADFLSQIGPQVGMSNAFLNAANNNISRGTDPITAQMIGDQTSALMSPYTKNVVDSLRGVFDDQLQSDLSRSASNSTLAGAFGSNRAALDQGQIRLANNRAFGENAGNLLNNAYQTASTNALNNLTGERNRFLQGAGLNINQSSNALGGANAYAQGAGAATALGQGNLAGSNQNYANQTERMKQLMLAGGVPMSQYEPLLAALQSFSPYSGGGAATSYQQPGLFQQLGLSGGQNSPFSGGLGSAITIGKGLFGGLF